MSPAAIPDPQSFLSALGGLHDVTVLAVTYDALSSRIELAIEDLNWNFERLEGYKPRPCKLLFSGVTAFSISAGQDKVHTSILTEGVTISTATAITANNTTRLDIAMATSETWYVEFAEMTVEDLSAFA